MTGGNSGIGLATVAALAAQGCKVACLDLADDATPTADSVLYVKCDITSEASVSAAVASIVETFGHIDILVNNAGVTDNLESVTDVSPATWHRVMAVNLNGPFHMMQACIPHMLKNDPKPAADAPPSFTWQGQQQPPRAPSKGVIINICSAASLHGAAAGAAYTASKHALLGLSRNTAWMYREHGLRVNAIMPGGVMTNMAKNSAGKVSMAGFQTLAPFLACQSPTLMMPDGIANAVLYLVGPGAEYISGAELAVDNAWDAA